MKGASSTKGKASRVKPFSRRHPFPKPLRWMSRRRRDVGPKLASCSSSEGSPERPVKVVVVGGDAGSGGDGSRVCVPVFGGGDRIPGSSNKIGESGSSTASVPKMAADGGRPNEPVKLEVCDSGRSKEAVKLGAGGSDGSPERVVFIGGHRIHFDKLGQLYVPDSEEEDGGSNGGRRPRSAVCARLAAAHAAGRAVVQNMATEVAKIADRAPEVAKAVDVPVEIADPAPEVAMAVDVPMGNAAAPDELNPALQWLLIVFVI